MMNAFSQRLFFAGTTGLLALAAVSALAADADDRTAYIRTDLVSNTQNLVQPADPNLQNAWGVASAPGGALWVSDNNSGVSTLYNDDGAKVNLTVTIPLPAGRAPPPPAAPTGIVWNPNSGNATSFPIPLITPTPTGATTTPAVFIFVTEDGTISAWSPVAVPPVNGKSAATRIIDNSTKGAVYKGLAFGTNKITSNGASVYLFATNFAAGTVEVYDQTFTPPKPGTFAGTFSDPDIPAGFAPFGIANVDNNLFVTYAKQNAQKNDVVAGPGLGFVNVFTTEGVLIKRFASGGVLNAPWGVARATQNFGKFSGDILIGNFGNQGQFAGWINAFSGGSDNDFRGPLRDANRKPLAIDGLWSIFYGTHRNSDSDTLYFTAGPNQQTNGLFGKIVAQPLPDADDRAP